MSSHQGVVPVSAAIIAALAISSIEAAWGKNRNAHTATVEGAREP
jgi:hypothetical protein